MKTLVFMCSLLLVACTGGAGDSDDTGCLGPACAPAAGECGDGALDDGEQCDGSEVGATNCIDLGYLSGDLECRGDCTFNTAGCFGTTTFCGDGVAGGNLGEECDGVDWAGATCQSLGFDSGVLDCTVFCRFDTSACLGDGPTCGDGAAEGTEDCDGNDLRGVTCGDFPTFTGEGLGCLGCSFNVLGCDFEDSNCGNDDAEGLELCDGSDLRGFSCGTFDFGEGALACDQDCGGFDFDGCDNVPECGNGVADGIEACDGFDLRGARCDLLQLGFGNLRCSDICVFDTSGCSETPQCGDNVADVFEACDGFDLREQSCSSLGLGDGTLACRGDCLGFESSECGGIAICGDDAAESIEACDGEDLGGATCESKGWGTGTLGCSDTCLFFDGSGCSAAPGCGNNQVDQFIEVCDGTDVGGNSCATFGLGTGSLGCADNCFSYDVSTCSLTPTCGNDDREGTELCDGSDVGINTCDLNGYQAGTSEPGCASSCRGLDFSGCGEHVLCGNGALDVFAGEQCEGDNVGFATCEFAGFGGGTLGCNANCSFSYAGCTL